MTPFSIPQDSAELMRRIRERIEAEGKTLAEFSREIGKGDKYHQVYAWLHETGEPLTSEGLRMLRWLAAPMHRLSEPIYSRPATTTAAKASKQVVKPKNKHHE